MYYQSGPTHEATYSWEGPGMTSADPYNVPMTSADPYNVPTMYMFLPVYYNTIVGSPHNMSASSEKKRGKL